jgi:lipopolysaccharide assembly outer membrane protein LptD (OstA)
MVGKEKIILRDVEYTACKEGLRDCGETPTWKIAASRITNYVDDDSLVYRNAVLYRWDVPVFWLPFFFLA